jgi:hypothetical protein
MASLLAVLTAISVASQGAAPHDELLVRAGRHATAFVEVISKMNCTEQVTQTKLAPTGDVVATATSTFDYLVLFTTPGGQLTLVESRLAAPARRSDKQIPPLLLTNGLSLLFLVFHPYYAAGFEFREGGVERVGDNVFTIVHFRHVPGTRSPAALALRGREFELDLEGTAWIDPETGTIARISAGLAEPMDDVGLHAVRADIVYAPIAFKAPAETYWLPTEVTVDVESRHQHWRNVHRFSGYRRFSVTSQEEVAPQ